MVDVVQGSDPRGFSDPIQKGGTYFRETKFNRRILRSKIAPQDLPALAHLTVKKVFAIAGNILDSAENTK